MNPAVDLAVRLTPPSVASAALPKLPRILMLSIVNPHVERNGAATVTRGLLKMLALPPLEAQVDCVPVRAEPLRWHRLAQARSLVLGSVSTLPVKAAFLYSKEFREKVVARVESEQYDLVVLNGADLLWISDYLPVSIPRILVAHNIEHLLFNLQIQNLGWLHRPLAGFLRKDCKRLQDYELEGIREAGNVIFLSHEEAAYADRLCEGFRSTTVPPVFDYQPRPRLRTRAGPTLEVGLLGNFKWWPNQLSLRWFANEILPYVKTPMRLNLFGHRGGRGWRGDPRIVEHGVVQGIERVWASCDFLICPTFSTGGVCVKLAEAVYNRMPVLATRHAVRGLPVGDDPALVLLDEPREWVEFLNSTAARDLAERQVSEETAAKFAMEAQKDALQQFVKSAFSCRAGQAAGA
jgi:glycosyltransferase involved in cell wall biosynthesis